jgi:hypothetical protein
LAAGTVASVAARALTANPNRMNRTARTNNFVTVVAFFNIANFSFDNFLAARVDMPVNHSKESLTSLESKVKRLLKQDAKKKT